MIIPPVIVRELRTALRKRSALKTRFHTALWASIGVWSFLLVTGGGSMAASSLNFYLFLGGLSLAVVPAARISVGLFAVERRNQTLELLYLAGMGPGELFAGKLLCGVLAGAGDLSALVPLLAVPFLCGGLSLDLFWATFACFPVLFLFTLSIGVLASVLSRDDGVAMMTAMALGAAVCLAAPLPYMLGMMVAGKPPFSSAWLCLSPAYAPYLVERNFSGAHPSNFWATAGITIVWSVAGLALASGLLRRNWRQEISRTDTSDWRERWRIWLKGTPAWREQLRQRLSSVNPFQWLVEQDRQPVVLAWALIGGTALFWLTGWAIWPLAWPSPANFILTAFVLVVGTNWIMAYAAASPIGVARQEGALEILLTTPLSAREIVEGQVAAVRAQFRPVRAALFGLCVVMMLGGLLTRTWRGMAIISYLILWGLILSLWFFRRRAAVLNAMWTAINTGRPLSALFRFSGGASWWICMAFNCRNTFNGLIHARHFPSGSLEEVFVLTFFAIALLLVNMVRFTHDESEDLLIRNMRLIAQLPVPDPDVSSSKWDGRSVLNVSPPDPNRKSGFNLVLSWLRGPR